MAVEIIAPYGTAVAVSEDWSATALSAASIMEVVANVAAVPTYRGAYDFTPSDSAQTVPTDGLLMDGDLTIWPIPSDYGHIAFDGSVLTVS